MKATREIIEKQFRSLDDFYLDMIRRHEARLKADLQNYETLIVRSWKWRVGSSLVIASVRIMNFMTGPVKFLRDKSYRDSWRGLNVNASPHLQFEPVLGNDALLRRPQLVLPVEEQGEPENQDILPRSDQSAITQGEAIDSMAVILDAPTTRLLSSQGNVFPLKPENFGEQLDQTEPGFFLCESASRGNGGAWQYKLCGESGQGSSEIQQLLTECKVRSIPTFFWMTCIPSMAEKYYQTAMLFDFILSPDSEMGGKLPVQDKKRIHIFPHAIDPGIHHPISGGSRTTKVCFLYDSNENMSSFNSPEVAGFLKPALTNGMDAFDTSYAESPGIQESFELLRDCNRGYLPYLQMAEKYKEYLALLNVTPTGRERRYVPRWIFEALASGLPVISDRNEILEELFGDVILFADSGSEVAAFLDRLLNDGLFRMQRVVKGVRAVISSHLIGSRVEKIRLLAGLNSATIPEPRIGLLIDAGEEPGLDDLVRCIQRQTIKPDAVAIFRHTPLSDSLLEEITLKLQGIEVSSFIYYQHQLYQPVRERMKCDYYMVWQRGCFYGDHYIEDYRLAIRYSPFSVYCKQSHCKLSGDQSAVVNPGESYRQVSGAPLSTVMMGREQLSGFNFLQMTNYDAMYDAFDECMVSLDSLNFLKKEVNRQGSLIPGWNELNV